MLLPRYGTISLPSLSFEGFWMLMTSQCSTSPTSGIFREGASGSTITKVYSELASAGQVTLQGASFVLSGFSSLPSLTVKFPARYLTIKQAGGGVEITEGTMACSLKRSTTFWFSLVARVAMSSSRRKKAAYMVASAALNWQEYARLCCFLKVSVFSAKWGSRFSTDDDKREKMPWWDNASLWLRMMMMKLFCLRRHCLMKCFSAHWWCCCCCWKQTRTTTKLSCSFLATAVTSKWVKQCAVSKDVLLRPNNY